MQADAVPGELGPDLEAGGNFRFTERKPDVITE
jgi:hypothetical protein